MFVDVKRFSVKNKWRRISEHSIPLSKKSLCLGLQKEQASQNHCDTRLRATVDYEPMVLIVSNRDTGIETRRCVAFRNEFCMHEYQIRWVYGMESDGSVRAVLVRVLFVRTRTRTRTRTVV